MSGKKLPQIVYRLANTFLKFKMVKTYKFLKILSAEREDKNINRTETF